MNAPVVDPACLAAFQTEGVTTVPDFLDQDQTRRLCEFVEPLLAESSSGVGVRRAIARQPGIREVLAETSLQDVLETLGGPGCRIIRAIVFDKSAGANWMVPWHQDSTIAVSDRIDVPGFGPWAYKDGEHHCRPPLEILASIVTVRLHLDACPLEAGPLRVIAGSHRLGLITEHQIEQVVREGRAIDATIDAGGAVLTTPLAVHSSRRSSTTDRRRTLHLDCSRASLPGGLLFAEAM